MKIRFAFASLVLLTIAGCHRGDSPVDGTADPAQKLALQQGEKVADDATREARIDALEARVDALENQTSASEDSTQDARLDMIEQDMAALAKIRTPQPTPRKPDNGTAPATVKPDVKPDTKPDAKPDVTPAT